MPSTQEKTEEVQREIANVKGQVKGAIDQALERQEKIEVTKFCTEHFYGVSFEVFQADRY